MLSRRELALLRAMYLQPTVTAAAASVHMSQPAASALLRDLETRLGFALFSREQRRLQLTTQGRSLIPEVLHALSAMDAVDRLASDIRKGTTMRLTVGAVAIASTMLLPQALVSVRQAHPQVALTVRAGTALEIVDMVVDHRVDLGLVITSAAAVGKRAVKERLAPLSLHAVFHPAHPLARRKAPPTLAAVAALGPIVLSSALPAGLATERAIAAAGLAYHPQMEVTQSYTACEFAAQQLGVAIVETLGARYAQRRGLVARHLLTLEDSELALVSPKDRPLEGAAACLRLALVDGIAQDLSCGASWAGG
ncbi:LysR family transcriptional regulator [Pseudorhodoferax sp. Leaf265]|uniref:LysR family transcriptional regulator n=1 Tax=Pseudorhodoferax sp. Leaf265 TaxID=1736315 RepID=UPI0006FC6273|nr:LysR family transcriptional regulator [Pseudorhodoferax sp. Leaf265]KQP04414.1 LysR family transcriptional regulator [Pseudorhodoferax sp. Leaf265]